MIEALIAMHAFVLIAGYTIGTTVAWRWEVDADLRHRLLVCVPILVAVCTGYSLFYVSMLNIAVEARTEAPFQLILAELVSNFIFGAAAAAFGWFVSIVIMRIAIAIEFAGAHQRDSSY